jgi:hypothetical protein
LIPARSCPYRDFIKVVNNRGIKSLKFSHTQIDDALTMMEKRAELEKFSVEDDDGNNLDKIEVMV